MSTDQKQLERVCKKNNLLFRNVVRFLYFIEVTRTKRNICDDDNFVPVTSGTLGKILAPYGGNYRKIIDILKENKIIDVNESYRTGSFGNYGICKKYKCLIVLDGFEIDGETVSISEPKKAKGLQPVISTEPEIAPKLFNDLKNGDLTKRSNDRYAQMIKANLERLRLDESLLTDKEKESVFSSDINKCYVTVGVKGGRYYHYFTNIGDSIRCKHKLMFKGAAHDIASLDIKTCQYALLESLFNGNNIAKRILKANVSKKVGNDFYSFVKDNRNNEDVIKFFDIVHNDDIYQYIADRIGETRQTVKFGSGGDCKDGCIMSWLFGAGYRSINEDKMYARLSFKIRQFMQTEFPTVDAAIGILKRESDARKDKKSPMAIILQLLEVELMKRVMSKIHRDNKPFILVHDCIYVCEKHRERLKPIIIKEAKETFNIDITVK